MNYALIITISRVVRGMKCIPIVTVPWSVKLMIILVFMYGKVPV